MVHLQDIKRGKEVQEELWCIICKTYGHHKDNFSTLMNYVATGASNPLNTQEMPWCRICQTRGQKSEECMYLQNIVSTQTSMYCQFCRYLGHDEKGYRSFHLVQEKIMDTYLMENDENMQFE